MLITWCGIMFQEGPQKSKMIEYLAYISVAFFIANVIIIVLMGVLLLGVYVYLKYDTWKEQLDDYMPRREPCPLSEEDRKFFEELERGLTPNVKYKCPKCAIRKAQCAKSV